MAKKQTRRSVSLSKDTYNLLKSKCDQDGVTMSGVVSQLIEDFLTGNFQHPSKNEPEETDTSSEESGENFEVINRGPVPSRFVVNTDLIVAGPSSETEAEQMVGVLVQRLVKKGDIAEALVLSADPE